MTTRFHLKRRVEFCETDAAGIVHFVSFYLYMEQAEHAFLRSLGLSVVQRSQDETNGREITLSWPRVKSDAEFLGSVRFEDMLDVFVSVERLGTKSVTYQFEIESESRPICKGSITAVCCLVADGTLTSIPVPENIRLLLQPFVNSDV
jgi:4-hydroxybenzoyl-CoA thioesterase/acyl-CoA thioester hydrolase